MKLKIFGCTFGIFCDDFHNDDDDDDEDDNNEDDAEDVRRAKFMRLADKLVSKCNRCSPMLCKAESSKATIHVPLKTYSREKSCKQTQIHVVSYISYTSTECYTAPKCFKTRVFFRPFSSV